MLKMKKRLKLEEKKLRTKMKKKKLTIKMNQLRIRVEVFRSLQRSNRLRWKEKYKYWMWDSMSWEAQCKLYSREKIFWKKHICFSKQITRLIIWTKWKASSYPLEPKNLALMVSILWSLFQSPMSQISTSKPLCILK